MIRKRFLATLTKQPLCSTFIGTSGSGQPVLWISCEVGSCKALDCPAGDPAGSTTSALRRRRRIVEPGGLLVQSGSCGSRAVRRARATPISSLNLRCALLPVGQSSPVKRSQEARASVPNWLVESIAYCG